MRIILILLLFCANAFAQYPMAQPSIGTNIFGVPISTVTALPTCNSANTNLIYTVSDALTPTIALLVVGGGAVTILVHCNGTIWIVG